MNNDLVNCHVKELRDNGLLDNRSVNICMRASMPSLFDIINFYFKNKTFEILRNCGEETEKILSGTCKKYIREYKLKYDSLRNQKRIDVLFDGIMLSLYNKFHFKAEDFEKYRDLFIRKKLPLFKLTLDINSCILSEVQNYTFKYRLGFLRGKSKKSYQEIAQKFGFSKERVRQIHFEIGIDLQSFSKWVTEEFPFIHKYVPKYYKTFDDFILIDNLTARQINHKEGIAITPKYCGFIYSIFLHKKYSFIQVLKRKYKNYYLVKNELVKYFDFDSFFKELRMKATARIPKEYHLSFTDFVSQYFISGKNDYFDRLLVICKKIAKEEYNLTFEGNDVVFARNTKQKLFEKVTKSLKDKQQPLTIYQLHELVNEHNAGKKHTIESIRSSIFMSKGVLAIGKTSTYALESWEHISTKTIKQHVAEYLSKRKKPIHTSELSKYINDYRKTSERSIYANLKLDNKGIYSFFGKGYIGLSRKKYKKFERKS